MGKFDFLETEYGLREVGKTVYAGMIRNFRTVIQITISSRVKYCDVSWSAYRDGDEEVLRVLLKPVQAIRGVRLEVKGAVVKVQIPVPMTANGMREKFSEVVETALGILAANGYRSGSFVSGMDDGSVSLVQRGPDYFYLTEAEYLQYDRDLNRSKEEDAYQHENMFLGLLGVLGVGILGIAAYVLVGILGYYVWLVPTMLVFGSYFAYRKMAGKITGKSLVLIFIILGIVILVATYLEYGWHLYDYFKQDYDVTYFQVLSETKDIILETRELRSDFVKDVAINGFALLVTIVICYFSLYRQETRFQELRKIV